MARKRKRRTTSRRKKRSSSTKWITTILVILVVLMGGYIGHHLYQRHLQQEIIEKQQNSKRLFIKAIAPEAQAMQNQYHIKASITMAQAILESNWGTSKLASQYHNLFGIKGSYNGQSIIMRTAEYGAGGYYYINDAFRKYPSNYESVVDHGRFLATNSRYHNLLWKKDYAVVTNYLHTDGYATDPSYASSLNNVIRTYNLDAWDKEVF